jgi:hypothetical protein
MQCQLVVYDAPLEPTVVPDQLSAMPASDLLHMIAILLARALFSPHG